MVRGKRRKYAIGFGVFAFCLAAGFGFVLAADGAVGPAAKSISVRLRMFGYDGETPRRELLRFHQALRLGDTPDAVLRSFFEQKAKHLELHQTEERWVVLTPLTLFEPNWILKLMFRAGRLTSIQIRHYDSGDRPPEGAPIDQQTEE